MATSVKSHIYKLGICYNSCKTSQRFLSGVTARPFSDSRLQRLPHSLQNTINRPNITSNQYISWPANTQIHKFPACVRHYSSQNGDEPSVASRKSLPQLMSFPQIVWPSVFKTIKNWIMINFIIRPYFDNEFNVTDFVAGTKHALQVVSVSLASGDVKSLHGLVSAEALGELQRTVGNMSMAQRNEILIKKEDIYLTYPYQVGIMFDETNEEIQKRWVEITMVFHVLRGLKEMQDEGIVPPLNIGVMPEYRGKISICNYRFVKEFTQGNESDWTINVVNHFKPADLIED